MRGQLHRSVLEATAGLTKKSSPHRMEKGEIVLTYVIFVLLAAALCFLLCLRLVLGLFPARVRLGRNCRCRLHLFVAGREPKLESSVRSLLWLLEQGGLRCGIVIEGHGLDQDTRAIALALAENYKCITLIEDGESPWIRKTNS